MPYILALDQGTTSSRAIVFDHDGAIRAVAQKEFTQIFPAAGWVEHDPQEIWASQIGVAVEALGRAARPAEGHRRHRHHQPARDDHRLGPRDRRAGPQRDRLAGPPHRRLLRAAQGRRRRRRRFRRRPACSSTPISPPARSAGFSTTCPGARATRRRRQARVRHRRHLAGLEADRRHAQHVTDVSNASRTMLFNIHTLQWDDELLRLFGVPASMLPEVRSSSEVYGDVSTALGIEQRADRRHRRRSAGGALRPDVPRSRACRRTPTAPAASCCRTSARRRRARSSSW